MHRVSTLWKANVIAFISSFCVMVIELIAARILAPHIGVSLYTWTSIIGVILAGIALGNYLGGKIADRHPSPLVLAIIFIVGGILTIAILPTTKVVASGDWFGNLPIMWNFTLTTSFIFFLPAIVLSMVSPMVIKLTLADLGRTGGVVGTIYACSTAGSILGTFMTGFCFILWFGTSVIVWLAAATLIMTGITAWFLWGGWGKWESSLKNLVVWTTIIEVVLVYIFLFHFRGTWQGTHAKEIYKKESNYNTILVQQGGRNVKVLTLDNMIHSYSNPDNPTVLVYDYVKVFAEIVGYITLENRAPRVLYLGGGGYTVPRYMEAVYPDSFNEVVEIDPAVTQVAYEELGLSLETSIKTYNQDARLYLIQRKAVDRYDIVIGDVFNDHATPYHLTTLEFNKLVKANMAEDGIYLINIVGDYKNGRYMPSFIHTLQQTFGHVYLFNTGEIWEEVGISTFVIVATDRRIDLAEYERFITDSGRKKPIGEPYDEIKLEKYLAERDLILLTDDYAPTDILVAPLFRKLYTAN
ncbi:fused MFS/spermidine synthase [Chloroflexota bacterium]